MQVKFGAIVTEGRGKLGGHVFQGNNGRAVMRSHSVPLQSAFRYRSYNVPKFATISGEWRKLSAAQRSNFNSFASSFNSIPGFRPSGFNTFLAANHFYSSIGYVALLRTLTNIATPVPPIVSVAFTKSPASIVISYTSWSQPFYIVRVSASKPFANRYQASKANVKVISAIYNTSPSPFYPLSQYHVAITPYYYTGQYVKFVFEGYSGGNPFTMPKFIAIVRIS